jgi:hypothetical protein
MDVTKKIHEAMSAMSAMLTMLTIKRSFGFVILVQGIVSAALVMYYSRSQYNHLDRTIMTNVEHKKYKHNFTYHHEIWEENSPRIVVLAGPHKTASTSIQVFISGITGSTMSLSKSIIIPKDEFRTPHPMINEWVWPIGVLEEQEFIKMSPAKLYAVLASLVMMQKRSIKFFPQWDDVSEEEILELRAKAIDYFRTLIRRPWEKGKKIVFGAELFDALVYDLIDESIISDAGEATHMSPTSRNGIDAFLDVLPHTSRNFQNQPSLQLEDIEVHINYRYPRIDHLRSIWHERKDMETLREMLMNGENIYFLNSLALALQFVRRGIKTTIIDMAGVFEKESKESSTKEPTLEKDKNETTETTSIVVVGGLLGVVACDILRIGNKSNGLCDDNSHLHLQGRESMLTHTSKIKNKKDDKTTTKLTEKQMEDINRAIEMYDCGVWQHLQKYQAKGLLRILYPSEHMFAICNPEGNKDISFRTLVKNMQEIASRDNGIPFQADNKNKI